MQENTKPHFADFIKIIPEGPKTIYYAPEYLKITGNNGRDVYVYKKIDGVYRSCSYQKNIPSKQRLKPKTKKAKINVKYVSTIAALFTLSALVWNKVKDLNKNVDEKYQIEQQMQIPKENEVTKYDNFQIVIENPTILDEKTQENKIETANENSIVQSIPFEIIQSNEMQSRKKTQELYGNVIQTYSEKYGLCSDLVEALITQERHKQVLDNPGQLTRNICGEEIVVPIINKNETELQNSKNVEKIYIVRDKPIRENFQEEQDYIKQLNRYKNQLEKSKELYNKGFEIIYFEDLRGENNVLENIRISIIWLAHCIYQCDCQINQGIFAYNQGYPSAKSSSDTEIMNGLAGNNNADIWYNYNVFQFLTKEEAGNMNFNLKPFPKNWAYFTETQKNEYYSKLSGLPCQKITLSLPIFHESLEEKYTNEKENGYSL